MAVRTNNNCFVCEKLTPDHSNIVFYRVEGYKTVLLESGYREQLVCRECLVSSGFDYSWENAKLVSRPETFYNCRVCGKSSSNNNFSFYEELSQFACFCIPCALTEFGEEWVSGRL